MFIDIIGTFCVKMSEKDYLMAMFKGQNKISLAKNGFLTLILRVDIKMRSSSGFFTMNQSQTLQNKSPGTPYRLCLFN